MQLKPGEPVPDPSTLTSNTINSTAKTDKGSYEQGSPGAPQVGAGAAQPTQQDSTQSGMFGVPPVTGAVIPESSLPMGSGTASEPDPGATISSAAPTSTTAQLAGQVPKEPKGVPEVVSDSQKKANVDPEASAQPDAVAEKSDVEKELQSKVPEEKPTSESGWSTGKLAAMAGGAAVAAGGVVAGAAAAAKDHLPTSVQQSIDQMNLTSKERATEDKVPEVVTDSQKAAHESPEAAANPEAVTEKSQVENELLKEVKPSEAAGEPAPTSAETSALSATAPTITESSSALAANALGSSNDPLKSSTEAIKSPNPEAAASSSLLNASKDQPAQSGATEIGQLAADPDEVDDRSREVSPMSKPPTKTTTHTQDQPTVTTGVADAKTSDKQTAGPSTPSKATDKVKDAAKNVTTPSSAKTTDSGDASGKKAKRRSFFGKIKDKLSGDKK